MEENLDLGSYIQINGEDLPITGMRQADSTGCFYCALCHKRWYVGAPLMELFRDLEQEMGVDRVLPRHTPCNTVMKLYNLPANLPSPVTIDDLDRIYFRAKIEGLYWGNVNAKEATDEQFESWIKTKLEISDEPAPWGLEERAHVCDICLQHGELVLLKKDEETK